mmetsp:Transcript_6660/g.14545  ORF Transcript_6660/g.14545 Transcript_6660/m.14545 type:complete len:223 (+) Transcript_6660:3089-3757(+)
MGAAEAPWEVRGTAPAEMYLANSCFDWEEPLQVVLLVEGCPANLRFANSRSEACSAALPAACASVLSLVNWTAILASIFVANSRLWKGISADRDAVATDLRPFDRLSSKVGADGHSTCEQPIAKSETNCSRRLVQPESSAKRHCRIMVSIKLADNCSAHIFDSVRREATSLEAAAALVARCTPFARQELQTARSKILVATEGVPEELKGTTSSVFCPVAVGV